MLACPLRPSRIEGAKHAAAVIKLLVTRLREKWPALRLMLRGDSGFCRQRLLRWCERKQVDYVIGVARDHQTIVPRLPTNTPRHPANPAATGH